MSTSSSERAVPYYCPFCASEDLWPAGEKQGEWECRSCTRAFASSGTLSVAPSAESFCYAAWATRLGRAE